MHAPQQQLRPELKGAAPPAIQPKLRINQPGDHYEQEADRVAEHVMRMPERAATNPNVERSTFRHQLVQARHDTGASSQPRSVPQSVNAVISTPGRPLDETTRSFMEPRFGHDFSQIRVHSGTRATESAGELNARAYTVGSDIVFGAGHYTPGTSTGRDLIAHELTHTIQQGRGGVDTASAAESEAGSIGRNSASSGQFAVRASTSIGIDRSPEDGESCPDLTAWSTSELQDELERVQESSEVPLACIPGDEQLQEQVQELEDAQAYQKEDIAVKDVEARKRAKPSKRKSRSAKAQAQAEAPALEKPRVLIERGGEPSSDPEEMIRQVDLINAWLRRSDVASADRDLLHIELSMLEPSVASVREERAQERLAPLLERYTIARGYIMDGVYESDTLPGLNRYEAIAAVKANLRYAEGKMDFAQERVDFMYQRRNAHPNLDRAARFWGGASEPNIDEFYWGYDKLRSARAHLDAGNYAQAAFAANLAIVQARESLLEVDGYVDDSTTGSKRVGAGLIVMAAVPLLPVVAAGAEVAAPVLASEAALGGTALRTGGAAALRFYATNPYLATEIGVSAIGLGVAYGENGEVSNDQLLMTLLSLGHASLQDDGAYAAPRMGSSNVDAEPLTPPASGPMRAPPGGRARSTMTATSRTLTPSQRPDPVVEYRPGQRLPIKPEYSSDPPPASRNPGSGQAQTASDVIAGGTGPLVPGKSDLGRYGIDTYGTFNAKPRIGDNLEGHELLPNLWLETSGYGTRLKTPVSRNNPAIGLTSPEHDAVDVQARSLGLFDSRQVRQMSASQAIELSAEAMRRAGIPGHVVAEFLRVALRYAATLPPPPTRPVDQ